MPSRVFKNIFNKCQYFIEQDRRKIHNFRYFMYCIRDIYYKNLTSRNLGPNASEVKILIWPVYRYLWLVVVRLRLSLTESWKTLALITPLFDQTGEVLSSLNWSLMRLARRPLPSDPQHLQACRAVPLRKRRASWRGNLSKGVELQDSAGKPERGVTHLIFLMLACSPIMQQYTSYIVALLLNAASITQTVRIIDNHHVCRWWSLNNTKWLYNYYYYIS